MIMNIEQEDVNISQAVDEMQKGLQDEITTLLGLHDEITTLQRRVKQRIKVLGLMRHGKKE